MKNQSVQQALETKFKDILALNCIPEKLQKDLEKLQNKMPSYFENVFFNQEELKTLIIEVTGLDEWMIKEFNSLKDVNALVEYCEYIDFPDYGTMIGFHEDTIIYAMYRTPASKDELSGLEIRYGSGNVQLTQSGGDGSRCGFSSTKKNFVKTLNNYFKD